MKEYLEILKEENSIITDVLETQSQLRVVVKNKSWQDLLDTISKINLLMDSFNVLDEQREKIASTLKSDTDTEKKIIAEIRGKLVKCRTENQALSEYINITKGFVKGVIDEALPQSRNKLYSRNGYIVQAQPECVVVDRLF